MSDDRKVMALMALAANFGKDLPDCLLAMWLDLLKPYSAQHVSEAVKRVILAYEYKTIPPFAILKRELDRLTGEVSPEKALPMQAEAEWTRLLDLLRRHGAYRQPDDLHPTTAQVLRSMGGWDNACQWEEAKLEWRRKEFIEAWQLAHGHVDLMALGAAAIEEGPVSAKALVEGLFANSNPASLAQ